MDDAKAVEAVARAIHAHFGRSVHTDTSVPGFTFDEADASAKEHYRGTARAAIATLRPLIVERCAAIADAAFHAPGLGWTPGAIAAAIREQADVG